MWVKSFNTTKFQHRYGSSGDLYYTKTLIKFKKTSSSAPTFVYFTVHFDDNGGDISTYPGEFKNQAYIVAYGIVGETDHVDSEVYDAHEAFEIDKTKIKMLVPLDMNGKKLINVNLEAFVIEQNKLKMKKPLDMGFYKLMNTDLNLNLMFFVLNSDAKYGNDRNYFLLFRKGSNNA